MGGRCITAGRGKDERIEGSLLLDNAYVPHKLRAMVKRLGEKAAG
jgi:hypothetical protein